MATYYINGDTIRKGSINGPKVTEEEFKKDIKIKDFIQVIRKDALVYYEANKCPFCDKPCVNDHCPYNEEKEE